MSKPLPELVDHLIYIIRYPHSDSRYEEEIKALRQTVAQEINAYVIDLLQDEEALKKLLNDGQKTIST